MADPRFYDNRGPRTLAEVCAKLSISVPDGSDGALRLDDVGHRAQVFVHQAHELGRLGVTAESVVRVNRQGDIEIRRSDRWEVIGGLLGEFEERIKKETGMDWL